MSVPADEHERTMAFAEIALGQIRALRQPASPPRPTAVYVPQSADPRAIAVV
jgi:hypothetical protein